MNTIQTFCAWSDLLGFSNPFEQGHWSFENSGSQRNVERLLRVWKVGHEPSSALDEVALFLNDGIARVHDFDPAAETPRRLLWWLEQTFYKHFQIILADCSAGFPGMRTVLCAGERVNIGEVQELVSGSTIGSKEFHERFGGKVCIYSPAEFQLNLAFSKAYFIESKGSAIGLSREPAFYIEDAVIESISKFLHGCTFEEFRGVEVNPQTQKPNRLEKLNARYAVVRSNTDTKSRIQFDRDIGDGFRPCFAFEHLSSPIVIDHRGLKTKIYEVTRCDQSSNFLAQWDNVMVCDKADMSDLTCGGT